MPNRFLRRKGRPRLVVKPHHPLRNILIISTAVIGTLVLLWVVYDHGLYRAGFDSKKAALELERLKHQIDIMNLEKENLHQQLSLKERSLQVDRQAYGQVNQSLEGLQAEILKLKEEVAFYKGIVTTADSRTGLRLQNFEMTPGSEEGGFNYRLVLAQVQNSRTSISGTVSIMIHGKQGGQATSLNMGQVARGPATMKFNFRNFQDLAGSLMLPAAFEPLRIQVQISVDNKGVVIEKTFEWAEILAS